MPKQFIKRFMPDHGVIRNSKYARLFGSLIHDPNLWHLNRRSASGGFAVGLFMAFLPVPLQMVLALAGAILFRVNLPISVALVWITNPLTIPPIFYACYKLGAWMLNQPPIPPPEHWDLHWLLQQLDTFGWALLVGSLTVSTVSAVIGYFGIRGLWRLHLLEQIKLRRARRQQRLQQDAENLQNLKP
jgi:uncharacterized protein (DUF2062 family)